MAVKSHQELLTEIETLPLPDGEVATPCFVVLEEAMLNNLNQTIKAAGGIDRLMPHVKTHRALWVNKWLVEKGIRSLKTATPAEVEISLEAGANHVLWAYPTLAQGNIQRVIAAANAYPDAVVKVLYDCEEGYKVWKQQLQKNPAKNIQFVLDLDPGMGRTGANIEKDAADLARIAHADRNFAGWHLYDGHIQDIDRNVRVAKNDEIVVRVTALIEPLQKEGLCSELIASGSWSFDIWPNNVAKYVTPGSFIYSSAQHQRELPHFGWHIGAYVLSSVVSARPGSATLDAGSKAISPDMLMNERFSGAGDITGMKEEHSIVSTDNLTVGERVVLVPKHACTTAYLYSSALVRTIDGKWETRPQLGNTR